MDSTHDGRFGSTLECAFACPAPPRIEDTEKPIRQRGSKRFEKPLFTPITLGFTPDG